MAQTINVPSPVSAAVPFVHQQTGKVPPPVSGLTEFGYKHLSDTQTAIAALVAQVAALNEKAGL
jgi:hypothetical protein